MSENLNSLPRSAIGKSLRAFRNRPLLIFWVGAGISNIGNWTENAAQSWAVTSQTIGNPHQGFLVEILQFADFCPVLLFALIAGVIADRVNRKAWLITLQTLAWTLGAGLAIAAYSRLLPLTLIIRLILQKLQLHPFLGMEAGKANTSNRQNRSILKRIAHRAMFNRGLQLGTTLGAVRFSIYSPPPQLHSLDGVNTP